MAQSLGTQTRNVNMNRFGHANRRLQLNKRGQLFIRTHNETLSVAAMRICNPDCLPLGIYGGNTAPTPTAFAEVVGDDFPVIFRWRAVAQSGMTAPAILCRPIANVPAATFPVLSISQ